MEQVPKVGGWPQTLKILFIILITGKAHVCVCVDLFKAPLNGGVSLSAVLLIWC